MNFDGKYVLMVSMIVGCRFKITLMNGVEADAQLNGHVQEICFQL